MDEKNNCNAYTLVVNDRRNCFVASRRRSPTKWEQGDKERIILSFLIILKHVRVDVQNSALVYILKLEARLNEIGIYILVIFIMSNFCSH